MAVGLALAALYARAEPLRSFLNILSPAPLVFLLLFLVGSPVSKLAFPDEASARTIGGVTQAPIVVVLLDELPSNTLVDEQDRLDTKRYPGFAELAHDATWFKNAYTSTTPPSAPSRRSWTATSRRRTACRSRPTTRTASSRCSPRPTG